MSRLTAYFLTSSAFAFLLVAVKLLDLHPGVGAQPWRLLLAPLWVPLALLTLYDFGRVAGLWAVLRHKLRRGWFRFLYPRRKSAGSVRVADLPVESLSEPLVLESPIVTQLRRAARARLEALNTELDSVESGRGARAPQ